MTHAFLRGPSLHRSLNDEFLDRLVQTERRMRAAHQTHLGYPYNLSFGPGVPVTLQQFMINNLGDPYVGSHYASEVCGSSARLSLG